jgi:dTDP-4-amino-4,6-dideoxygalactose transaminase
MGLSAVLAHDIKSGDEVIMSSLTFIADQNIIHLAGVRNILVDVTSLEDWSMEPQEIENHITPRTKAVMIIHYAGYACEMDKSVDIYKCHKR